MTYDFVQNEDNVIIFRSSCNRTCALQPQSVLAASRPTRISQKRRLVTAIVNNCARAVNVLGAHEQCETVFFFFYFVFLVTYSDKAHGAKKNANAD